MKKIIFLLLLLTCINNAIAMSSYEQQSGFFLNYNDLIELSRTPKVQGKLEEKLKEQLNTIIIQQPPIKETSFLHEEKIGDILRVVTWNIERGFNLDSIEEIPNYALHPRTNEKLRKELNFFSSASIIILNEVDVGLPRTSYQNIASRIAKAFKMGYVFGTEFVEVDPYQLGVKKFTREERTFLEQEVLRQLDNIQKDKFLGLHGSAILTRYPIISAYIIRLPDCYNWYLEEANKLSTLELVRRQTAETIFASKVLTELRHGGRMAIVADLLLPNDQVITVVVTHLENRCLPQCRYTQFEFLLNRLKSIKNPLVLGGDFNTTGTDVSPVVLKKEVLKRVKNPEFIVKYAILSLTPIGFTQNFLFNAINALRQYRDPTTRDIPIILPNKEWKIFDLLKNFKFDDGNTFDLRGNVDRSSHGHIGLLSNSNERNIKGFKSTFELERHFGIAKYKLDWFFVKPLNLKSSNDKKGSYIYAPCFGRTLKELNRSFGKISDHDPISVDVIVESMR